MPSSKPQPDLQHELALWQAGYRRVAGVDEAGRGAWAGPVMVAAVVLPPDPAVAAQLAGVNDSKQLSAAQRERLYDIVVRHAMAWSVSAASAQQIDAIGIAAATRQAMLDAISAVAADFALIDYVRLPELALPQHSLPKGDSKVLSIAAASILAKVTRDRWLAELGRSYPMYGFERHKGYGVAAHQRALQAVGPCAEHRHSFAPIRAQQLALFPAITGDHP